MKPRKAPPLSNGPDDSVTVSFRIQPRASKNELVRQEDGGLKIRLTAPPVDNAANEALVRFIADLVGASKSQVTIVSGHTSRDKVIRISGMNREAVNQLLSGKGK